MADSYKELSPPSPPSRSGACACGGEARRARAGLTFEREELLYDIRNLAYVEGDTMGEDKEHSRHQVTDICEEGNIDRVLRVIGTAFSECVETLYPYTKEALCGLNSWHTDIPQTDCTEYSIPLDVPTGFSGTTLRLLEKLVHEYMVSRALADWMSIVKPEAEERWTRKYEAIRGKIRSCLTSRSGRTRRRMRPF